MFNDDRVPTRDELFTTIDYAFRASSGVGRTGVHVAAYYESSTRWSRNRIGQSANRADCTISLSREIDGGWGTIRMNQLDEESIQSAIKFAEWKATTERREQEPKDFPLDIPEYEDPPAMVWSDATAKYDAINAGKIIQLTCQRAEEQGLMAAGYISCLSSVAAYAVYSPTSEKEYRNYVRLSRGECSVTARDAKGLGSGWSGVTDIDMARVDEESIANLAVDKCIASLNPMRIEPGRYTAILEPQAVADLVGSLLFANGQIMDRSQAESPPKAGHAPHPFYLGYDPGSGLHRSKLGLRVFDERINVWHDPMDPELGVVGFSSKASGVKKISYVEHGVLKSLAYNKLYAANRLESNDQNIHRMSFRMSGGDTSIEDMIASTKRGILVTRFSQGGVTDASSLVATGLTRDGLWLVENGAIRHAIRNFRTLESPFFVLNSIEQVGPVQKVYVPAPFGSFMRGINTSPIGHNGISYVTMFSTKNFAPQFIVPALKVRDFSFAASIDAV